MNPISGFAVHLLVRDHHRGYPLSVGEAATRPIPAVRVPACRARTEPDTLAVALTLLAVIAANAVASATTRATVNLMGGVSPFALEAMELQRAYMPYIRFLSYAVPITLILLYLWPLIRFLRSRRDEAPSIEVQRRVISGPLVTAGLGFSSWLFGAVFFPVVTVIHFGHWSGDLASQQVLSPLINGFLAATTSYLLMDWVFRRRVVPRVFPEGRLADVPGSIALSVRGRLVVYLIAVAFMPLFTLLGLVRAAGARLEAGLPVAEVMSHLSWASQVTFLLYVLLGIGLTWMLARTLTDPIEQMVAALRRVRGGDIEARVDVTSSDEIGVLEDGVNAMVDGLRERERILQTFGRVVEPSVRDRLLQGELAVSGEVRVVSVLFCDMRGFTAMAEHTPASDLVTTMNEYFGAITGWVRECGGYVDKFIGDAVLVVFGLFETDLSAEAQARSATAALECALGMQRRLDTLNTRRSQRGCPPLAVKIGVHTGEVVAGTIGARERHEYTVIGDTVNIAARLERLCKKNGCGVLISGHTLSLARAQGVEPAIDLHDSVVLEGRSEAVTVFGVRAA